MGPIGEKTMRYRLVRREWHKSLDKREDRERQGRREGPEEPQDRWADGNDAGLGDRPGDGAGDALRAEEWVDKGRAALERGDLEGALRCFQRAVQICPTPAAVNNLALMMLEQRNDPAGALRILQPHLSPASPSPHPFALATAARCYQRLGGGEAARRHLQAAVQAFERGPEAMPFPIPWEAWREYTAAILQAAGALEDDRLVWELYRRWSSYHVLPASFFFGGIAAFNLQRFEAAVRAWRQIREAKWKVVQAFIEVAELCETGLVPPFRLRYGLPEIDSVIKELEQVEAQGDRAKAEAKGAELIRRMVKDPLHRVLLLSEVLGAVPADRQHGSEVMVELVANSGDWGQKLASAIFLSSRTTMSQKIDAARGLMKAGVIAPGDQIRVYVDGRVQEVSFRQLPVELGPNPELEAKHQEAIALRDAGKIQEAKAILETLVGMGECFWPPAAITYAHLLQQEGKLKEARNYLEMARSVMPHEPVVLMSLAWLSIEEWDLAGAADLLKQVRSSNPEVMKKVRLLEYFLRHPEQLLR